MREQCKKIESKIRDSDSEREEEDPKHQPWEYANTNTNTNTNSPHIWTIFYPWGSISFSTHHWLFLFSTLSLSCSHLL